MGMPIFCGGESVAVATGQRVVVCGHVTTVG